MASHGFVGARRYRCQRCHCTYGTERGLRIHQRGCLPRDDFVRLYPDSLQAKIVNSKFYQAEVRKEVRP